MLYKNLWSIYLEISQICVNFCVNFVLAVFFFAYQALRTAPFVSIGFINIYGDNISNVFICYLEYLSSRKK